MKSDIKGQESMHATKLALKVRELRSLIKTLAYSGIVKELSSSDINPCLALFRGNDINL